MKKGKWQKGMQRSVQRHIFVPTFLSRVENTEPCILCIYTMNYFASLYTAVTLFQCYNYYVIWYKTRTFCDHFKADKTGDCNWLYKKVQLRSSKSFHGLWLFHSDTASLKHKHYMGTCKIWWWWVWKIHVYDVWFLFRKHIYACKVLPELKINFVSWII